MGKERYDELHVVAEDSAKECDSLGINYPLYINCYYEALGAILKNIDLMEEEHGREQTRQKNRNKNRFLLRSDISDINCSEFANIIAFIGTRGSGKTTAINEFCDILSRYGEEEEKWDKRLSYKNDCGKPHRFWIMPPIDASVLEAKEDLIELIWANMYQVFEAEFKKKSGMSNYEELSKKIMKEFDEVYKNYNNVGHSEKREVLGESVLVKLKNVSSSLKTREAFEKLIKNFLDMLDGREENEERYHGNNGGNSYLVITVDDLDLNLEKGYEMLEQMHKYLFNRRIIVLIAVDYGHLHLLSEKYFMESLMPKIPSGAYSGQKAYEEFGNIVRKAKKLNDDYLLKVLPLSNRIYLSGGNIISKQIKVSEAKKGEKGEEETVKAFILKKIVDKTLIYYDACGKKKHFCLPGTIRELTSYNQFLNSLYSMEEIEEGKGRDDYNPMYHYDQNHDRFNYDITDRMASQVLNEGQLDVFKLIVQRNIERRAEYAVNFLRYYKDSKFASEALKDKVDETEYRYGDLLGEIYDIGREDYNDKVLSHCILASFTSEMVREYYSYCNNRSNEDGKRKEESIEDGSKKSARNNRIGARQRAKGRLANFLGSTFGGEWFEEGMPNAVLRSDKNKTLLPIGYFEKSNEEKIFIEREFSFDINSIKGVKKFIEDLIEYVPYLECISLLFSNLRNSSGKVDILKWNFLIKSGITVKGSGSKITMTSEVEKMDFDLFGFVGREIKDVPDMKKRFLDNLCDSMYICMKDVLLDGNKQYKKQQLEEWKKLIEEKAYEKSIWRAEDKENENVVYLPFYNLDLTYNVMKRVRNRTKGDSEVELWDIAKYFQRVYGYIAEELDKEDKAYIEMGLSEQRHPHLLENFNCCPFIKAFGYGYKEENLEGGQEEQSKLYEKGSLKESELNAFLSQIVKSTNTSIDLKEQDMEE